MRNLLFLTFVLFTLCISAQSDQILTGKISLEKLKNSDHSEWFLKNYNSYKPKKTKLKKLQKALHKGDFKFEIFFGTWCPDSQREVPRVIKIFENISLEKDDYDLIGVNRYKDLPESYKKRAKEINLKRVPTLIFYKNNKEVNRYVEFAQISLLDDLLAIVLQKNYKHSYFSN